MIYKKGDKVIAIKNAPDVRIRDQESFICRYGLDRAYNIGDIFEVDRESFMDNGFGGNALKKSLRIVIKNHKISDLMDVDAKNFILLSEFRENQINSVLDN